MTTDVEEPTTGCPFAHPTDFTPWDPEYVSDPYPTWEWFRAQAPVFYSEELDYWVISRHESIKQILLDPDRVSATVMSLTPTPWPDDIKAAVRPAIPDRPLLSNLNGKEHDDARRFLRTAFTPRRLQWVRPHVEEIVDDCLRSMITGGTGDLVTGFCSVAPLRVLMRFLGIPDAALHDMKKWSSTREAMFQGKLTEQEIHDGAQPLREYYTYARERIGELEQDPGEDYMSELIQQWKRERPANVERDDLLNILVTLMSAGHQTTADLSANGLRELLSNREQWHAVCADPALVPAVVDEMLRWETSVPTWRRVTLEEIEVDGQTIPAGARLLMFLGSANRDEDVVDDGARFDVNREDGRNYLTFGAGRHYCLGQPLAKLELNVMVERICALYPDLELVEDQTPRYRLNMIHRGPDSVPVRLGSGASASAQPH